VIICNTSSVTLIIIFILLIFPCRSDKIPEQGMGTIGTGFEFRVKLSCHKPGVSRVLDNFHQEAVGPDAAENQACPGQTIAVKVV
jgi:hypothetical protein